MPGGSLNDFTGAWYLFEGQTGLPTLILTVRRVSQEQGGATQGSDESAKAQRPGVGGGAGTKKNRKTSKKSKKEFDERHDTFYILQNVKYICRPDVEFVRLEDRRACEWGGKEMRRRLPECCSWVSQEFGSSLSLKRNAGATNLLLRLLRLGESGI